MNILKASNLALRFLLELCALAALGYWGVRTGQGLALKVALGAGAPLLLAIVWGILVAPRSAVILPRPVVFTLGFVLLELSALALAAAGQGQFALVYAVVIALNAALIAAWRQFPVGKRPSQ